MNTDSWRFSSTFCLFFCGSEGKREKGHSESLIFLHSFWLEWTWWGVKGPGRSHAWNDEKKEAGQAGIWRNCPRNSSLKERKSERTNWFELKIWILSLSLPLCPWTGCSSSLVSALSFIFSSGGFLKFSCFSWGSMNIHVVILAMWS